MPKLCPPPHPEVYGGEDKNTIFTRISLFEDANIVPPTSTHTSPKLGVGASALYAPPPSAP